MSDKTTAIKCANIFSNFTVFSLNICNNNDQFDDIRMILSFINIRKATREVLKTSGFALGFQHLLWDLANVINEWKIMFDPYIENRNMFNSKGDNFTDDHFKTPFARTRCIN